MTAEQNDTELSRQSLQTGSNGQGIGGRVLIDAGLRVVGGPCRQGSEDHGVGSI